jgi:hypothetical protein
MYMRIAGVAIPRGSKSESPTLTLAERQQLSILSPLEELHSGAVYASMLDMAIQSQGGMLGLRVAKDDPLADA